MRVLHFKSTPLIIITKWEQLIPLIGITKIQMKSENTIK